MSALSARLVVSVADERGPFRVESELALEKGVLVLFGPYGTGKSLTLQALAGLLRPESGSIQVGNDVLFDAARGIDLPAHRRRIGYVPQSHALFPFLDVEANVGFGLPRAERRRGHPTVGALLEELEIAALARARPAALSGGEQQRVALARALAVSPRLILLDEPFASIDRGGREGLRKAVRAAVDRHRVPAVLVTHDPEDATALADRVVRFQRGAPSVSGPPETMLPRGAGIPVM